MVTDQVGISKEKFDSIPEALNSFAKGEFLIVMDNEDRENEGDLIIAAEHITSEKMAFLIRYSSGYVCAPTTAERLEQLDIPLMVPNPTDPLRTAYGVSIDLKEGTTTGISASDRAKTCAALGDPKIISGDAFIKPGHILPLKAVAGGVLERPGHTEACVDLCKLSGVFPAGIIGEIVNDDGTMKRRDDCLKFSELYNIKIITIEDLVKYRQKINV
ncbi:3,4-dihydroxy-2-butanone 4-phosphate synthase [Neoconidiobolus thromboides FSU 785]|nr:3,4-dihydroxy-2-butanone 4-phosphate synthase [Neoconidiobolus thromboides FSU 785]